MILCPSCGAVPERVVLDRSRPKMCPVTGAWTGDVPFKEEVVRCGCGLLCVAGVMDRDVGEPGVTWAWRFGPSGRFHGIVLQVPVATGPGVARFRRPHGERTLDDELLVEQDVEDAVRAILVYEVMRT